MARRSLFVATVAALIAAVPGSVGAQTTGPPTVLPPTAYLAPGPYAGAELKSFTARDAQPLYTDALKQACTNAAGVDAAVAPGPPSSNGVLLGTTDGRIVVSESIRVFPDTLAAKRFVAATRSSPGCVAYGARDSFNRVFVQYPQPPPLPTFAPTVVRDGTTTSGHFEGTSAAAPLSGVAAVITWANYVAETAIRIAVPKPGELDALSASVLRSAAYAARAATGVATNAKLSQQADALVPVFLASPGSVAYAFAPAARTGVPASPPTCTPLADAYVDSGVNAAARGFAGTDAATRISARPEIIVYAKPAAADRLRNFYRDLATCLPDQYKSGLPSGSTVAVQRVPKRGTGSIPKRPAAQTVAYISTLKGPDGAQLGKVGIGVVTVRNRAATVVAQLVSPDPNADIATALNGLQRDLGSALAQQ